MIFDLKKMFIIIVIIIVLAILFSYKKLEHVGIFYLYHPPKSLSIVKKILHFLFGSLFFVQESKLRNYKKIKNKKGEVIAYFLDKKSDTTVLYFYGNGCDAFDVSNSIAKEISIQLNANILIFEYYGYGNRTGIPCMSNILADFDDSWFNYIKELSWKKNLVIYGNSLGCAIALSCASKFDGKYKLILQNPFYSVDAMMEKMEIPKLLRYFVTEKWDNAKEIKNIKAPVLFLCGTLDGIIPLIQKENLFKKCNSKVKYFESFAGGHNDNFGPNMWKKIRNFIRM